MFDTLRDAIAANQLEAAAYSPGVRVWMGVMGAALLSAVIFAPARSAARWVLAAAVVNIAGLILIKAAQPDLSRTVIGTVLHLVFWTPVLAINWRPAARAARRLHAPSPYNRVFSVWLVVVSLVMATSLVLDARIALGWIS